MNEHSTEKAESADSDFLEIYTRLLGMARASSHRDSGAEDRVQEAYLRLLEATPCGQIANREGYFHRILRNLKIDGARRQSRYDSAGVSDQLIDPQAGPERVAELRQELAIVARALDSLPPRCRDAFELHRFAHLSYAEIAKQMGISISMVEKHISTAILRLAAALGK